MSLQQQTLLGLSTMSHIICFSYLDIDAAALQYHTAQLDTAQLHSQDSDLLKIVIAKLKESY